MKRSHATFVGIDAAIVVVILALAVSASPTLSTIPPTTATMTKTTTITSSNSSTNTPTMTSSTNATLLQFSSPVGANGLQVNLYLNSTSMPADGALMGFVTVANTLDENVTVTPLPQDVNLTSWPGGDIAAIDPCGSIPFPGGYAVFQGHFDAGNISSAETHPLVLTPGPGGSCGAVGIHPALTFIPGGGQAVRITVAGYPNVILPDQLNVTSTLCTNLNGCVYQHPGLVGYWTDSTACNGNATCSLLPFWPFSPGEYTIVAWDDWNQFVYVTFVVQPAASSG